MNLRHPLPRPLISTHLCRIPMGRINHLQLIYLTHNLLHILQYLKLWYIIMIWKIQFTNKAAKQVQQLEERVVLALQVLVDNLKINGPAPGKHWHNYSRLHGKKQEDKRHCHLIKGNPTYVCCWEVNKLKKLIEIYYVGTHEKAPY